MADKSFAETMAAKMAGGGDDGAPPDSSAGDDTGDAYKAACSALIDAIHSKDVDGVADAFKQMYSLCPDGDGDDDDGDKSGGHAALLLMPHPGKGAA